MNQTLQQPKFRGVMHHFMFFVSLVACIPLILKSTNSIEATSTIVYSIGLLSMFGFSALYHRKKTTVEIKKILRKLDHSGIFLMIAGTFTPICLLSLPLDSGIQLLTIIWGVAIVGILQSIFFSKIHRLLRASIYLVAGWVALPFMPMLVVSLSFIKLTLVITGGVIYSLGATAYGFRFPKLNPDIFGFHEVFHTLVVIAAILHFIVIYNLI
tara:strand:+ start:150 stop:785 length:636 start_codon:yes stop_codon:yes gene_type:complete